MMVVNLTDRNKSTLLRHRRFSYSFVLCGICGSAQVLRGASFLGRFFCNNSDRGNGSNGLIQVYDYTSTDYFRTLLKLFLIVPRVDFKVIERQGRIEEIHIYKIVLTHYDQHAFARLIEAVKVFFGCSMLIDAGASDLVNIDQPRLFRHCPKKLIRFAVNYMFGSLTSNVRIYVHALLGKRVYEVLTLTHIYVGMNWLEREMFDMFGVLFINHPNLRRLLTDYGFSGYPLRKDFPVSGFYEVRYDDEVGSLVYDHVLFQQMTRQFVFQEDKR